MNEQQKKRATELYNLIERNITVLTANTSARRPVEWMSESYANRLNLILRDIRILLEGVPGLRYLSEIPEGKDSRPLEVILLLNDYIYLLDARLN